MFSELGDADCWDDVLDCGNADLIAYVYLSMSPDEQQLDIGGKQSGDSYSNMIEKFRSILAPNTDDKLDTLVRSRASQILTIFKLEFASNDLAQSRLLLQADRQLRQLPDDSETLMGAGTPRPPWADKPHLPRALLSVVQLCDRETLMKSSHLIIPPSLQMLDHVHAYMSFKEFDETLGVFHVLFERMPTDWFTKYGLMPVLEEAMMNNYWSFRTTYMSDISSVKCDQEVLLARVLNQILSCLRVMAEWPEPIKSGKKVLTSAIPIPDPRTKQLERVEKFYSAILSGALDTSNHVLRRVYCDELQWWTDTMGPLALKHLKHLVQTVCRFMTGLASADGIEVHVCCRQFLVDNWTRFQSRLSAYHGELLACMAECFLLIEHTQIDNKDELIRDLEDLLTKLRHLCSTSDYTRQFEADFQAIRSGVPSFPQSASSSS
jgi:hypothetical protein